MKKRSNLFSPLPMQCVPAGVLPLLSAPCTQTSSSFQAPPEFEDVMQMIEWLILLESKLQPEKIIVGDFVQLRRLLRDTQVWVINNPFQTSQRHPGTRYGSLTLSRPLRDTQVWVINPFQTSRRHPGYHSHHSSK